MAPNRRPVPKERFSALFSTLRTQSYYDPASRGAGNHSIQTIAWNPNGHLIATGAADKTLRIWNPDKPQVKNSTELRGHTGAIEAVAWNPTREAELASVSRDGTCRFWDVRSKGCMATVPLGGEGQSLSWAPNGSMVLAGSRKVITPIQVPSFSVCKGCPQTSQANATTFAPVLPDDVYFSALIASSTGAVNVVSYPRAPDDNSSMKVLHTIASHTSACQALELAPNGRYLATGGSDATICLWDTTEWACRRTLDRIAGTVRSLSFSWDGNFIVGGTEEGNGMEIAHVETGEYVHTVATSAPAQCVAWHPSRYWIAYAGETGGLRIVGAAGGQL